MKKILLIVLDGAADLGPDTPFSQAKKPNIDLLAKNGRCGLIDIGYKKTVDSDIGFLTLLSMYSKETYPGRGYLEALGAGIEPKEKDMCLRCDFATLGKDGNLVDRRAGREELGLQEFAEHLDGMEIDGVEFIVKKSAGHRIVILMKGESLSQMIIPNDPLKTNVPVPQIKPRDPDAKFTASVLNKFLARANKILSKEPLNKKRKFPANIILVRNTGRKKISPSFQDSFGLKGCCIAGIPIAKGVSKFLNIDFIEVPRATGMPDTNLSGKTKAVIEALKKYDFVWLHINGADTLSHDKKREEKARFIEKVDMEIGKIIKAVDLEQTIVSITSDHRTVSLLDFKEYEHIPDPVPVLISGGKIKSDRVGKFDETSVLKGSIRINGNGLILILSLAKI